MNNPYFKQNKRNVFKNDDGRLIIGDFGLSKLIDKIRSSTKCAGTFPYMSPECFRHGNITHSSDIWYTKNKNIYIKQFFLPFSVAKKWLPERKPHVISYPEIHAMQTPNSGFLKYDTNLIFRFKSIKNSKKPKRKNLNISFVLKTNLNFIFALYS